MLSEKIRKQVEQATVKLTKQGGQGVLVSGGFILTAAHCIDYSFDGSMTQGAHYVEEVETIEGTFQVQCYVVEPVCDIAVLGEMDNQEYDTSLYLDFCENVEPVPIYTGTISSFADKSNIGMETKAYIYTHEGRWIAGKAKQVDTNSQLFWFDEHRELIKGGTSGGPIVNERGELLGIVSTSSFSGHSPGMDEELFEILASHQPRACNALPVWIIKKILGAQE